METGEVHARFWHQRGQAGDEIQWLENDVRGPVTVGCLEAVADLALAGQGQAFVGNGRSGDVAAKPFELVALVGSWRDTAVQREAGGVDQSIVFDILVARSQGLQRAGLLTLMRPHGNAASARRRAAAGRTARP